MSKAQFVAKVAGDAKAELNVEPAAVDPLNAETIYASFNVSFAGQTAPVTTHGLYVSHNGGDTWSLFSKRLMSGSLLAISPSNHNILLGVSMDGLVRSVDGGKTWDPILQQNALMAPAFLPNTSLINKAAKESGTSPSDVLACFIEKSKAAIWDIRFHNQDPSFILLLMNKGLLQSTDQGNSWHLLDLGSKMIGFVNSATYDRRDPRTIYVGTVRVMKSTDGGCSFKQIYPRH